MSQVTEWYSKPFAPDRIRGTYFDLAVFLGNFFLLPVFIRIIQQAPENPAAEKGMSNPLAGMLFFAAVIAQALGACLKRSGLQGRLAKRDDFKGKTWSKFFGGAAPLLLIFHYIVFCSALAFGISCFLPYGIDMAKYQEHPAFIVACFVFLIVSLVPTIFVVYALTPYNPAQKPSKTTQVNGAEIIADILLFFSVEVIVAFWSGLFLDNVYKAPQAGGFHPMFALAMTLLLAVPFFMFYIIPRMLFFVEDSKYVGTWIRMFIAMLPMSWYLLKG